MVYIIKPSEIDWIIDFERATALNTNRPLRQVVDKLNIILGELSVSDLGTMAARNYGVNAQEHRDNGQNDSRFWQKTQILNIGNTPESARAALGLGGMSMLNPGASGVQFRNNTENDDRFWQKTQILNIGSTVASAKGVLGIADMAAQMPGTAGNQFRNNTENDDRFWQKTQILNIGNTVESAKTVLGIGTMAAQAANLYYTKAETTASFLGRYEGFGTNQSYSDVRASRVCGVRYYAPVNKAMLVVFVGDYASTEEVKITIGSSQITMFDGNYGYTDISFIVPAGSSYIIPNPNKNPGHWPGTLMAKTWSEMR